MTSFPCNATEVKQYVAAIYDPDDIVEVRYIWPDPSAQNAPRSEWHRAADLADPDVLQTAQKFNSIGWGVYVGVNPRKVNGGRKANDVATCRCLFVDFDGVGLNEAQRRIDKATLPAPTLIIASGRKDGFHFYWRLAEPVTVVEDWRQYQRGLIKALDSDPAIHDPPRVMRLPGFNNTKHNGRPACSFVEHNAARVYDLVEFDDLKAPARVKPEPTDEHSGKVGSLTRRYLDQPTPDGDRNATLFKAACDLRGRKCSQVDAEHLLLPAAQRDGLSDTEARKTIGSAFSQEREPGRTGKKSQATILVDLALNSGAVPFHDPDRDPYITIDVGHTETWPMRSRAIKRWLVGMYYRELGAAPNAQATNDALTALEAAAIFDGPKHDVRVRVAGDDETIYVDLANDDWQAIRVTADGWKVVDQPDVHFRRTKGMMALPTPQRGGTVDELDPFINLDLTGKYSEFPLMASWMIAALRPTGPYPVLVLGGSHGAGKSYACRLIRSLIDPNKSALRAPPRSPHDLAISASNSWVFTIENISEIRPWLSDCLARLATGAGFATRELYSDAEETLFAACRPILINGIGTIVTAPDLLDRSIQIDLGEIPRARRRTEKDLMADFDVAAPRLLGALLDGVVEAMRNVGTTTLDGFPRMADFACWATACELAMPWAPGAFMKAYAGSQQDADLVAIEATPIGQAIRALVAKRQEPWEGTATDLLETLRQQDGQDTERPAPKSWPVDATRLGNVLRRLAPNLRTVGIQVEFSHYGRERSITLSSVAPASVSVDSADVASIENGPGVAKNAVCDATTPTTLGNVPFLMGADDVDEVTL